MKQHGDDTRLKPDDWAKEVCKNCEHLQKDEHLYCGRGFTVDLENPKCRGSFKSRYRNYK